MHSAPLPAPFNRPEALRRDFVAGLERLLAAPDLGTFILVLANASFDATIWDALGARLADRFAALAGVLRADLRDGRSPAAPDDDLMVFLKLMAMGFDAVRTTESRAVGPWQAQFNPLRALRPARASRLAVTDSRPPPFDAGGFHFNRPFLRPEILWEGVLLGHAVRILYNKFPFVPLHALLVPEPERARPQWLDQETHLYAWHLARALERDLPGAVLAYNSYAAQASVNHLHLQIGWPALPLPVTAPDWRHNGGSREYPLPCRAFFDPIEAWFEIERMQSAGQPFNLIHAGARLYAFARRAQGRMTPPAWMRGPAWYELAGGMTLFARADFDGLDADAVGAALASARPN